MIHSTAAGNGNRFLAGFALLTLAAVGAGCVIAAAHGIPAGVWARNLAAWGVGGLAAWGIARRASLLPAFLVAAPAGLLLTFVDAGQQGVHRWVQLGPLNVNGAAVLLPAAAVALGVLRERRWSWMLAAATLALLVAQPDASQATAFGAAMLVVLAGMGGRMAVRAAGAAATVLAVAAAWLRPDPLAPVPEVEEIIGLALAWSPAAAVAAVVLLAAAGLWPLRIAMGETADRRVPALALAACLLVTALAPLLGAFPVPLVGMGMSPVLGFWLGAGALAATRRSGAGERGG